MKKTFKVLIFSPSVAGGIAEHTLYQARAFTKEGAEVLCLVAPSFLQGRSPDIKTFICLPDPLTEGSSGFLRKLRMAWRIILSRFILLYEILRQRPDLVLLDSYVEYLSPLWVWPHWFLAKILGVRYAANLHDPVRNYIVGPLWWHRLSVRLAYQPLDFVLVHDALPEPSPVPKGVRVVQVPVGIYEIRGTPLSASGIRKSWGVQEGQKVFLSFGSVRDGKNLDLAVQALAQVPEAFLVLAGAVASCNDKNFTYYRELAARLGVMNRCYFVEGFVADEELGHYFSGTDFVLLIYAASFHSQSGVLHLAARAHKAVLASAAPSPLLKSVRDYGLGKVILPDSLEEVVLGMQNLLKSLPQPRWEDYEASASWDLNAREILKAAKCVASS